MELSYYKRDRIRENLKYFYDKATEEDKASGKAWYYKAHEFCARNAVQYGYNIETVGAVVSALSPRNKWERNLIDAEAVLNAVRNNIPEEEIKVCTFNSNKAKAFNIARLKEVISSDAMKTFAFLQNIVNLNPQYVTIDIWHQRAAFNKMKDIKLNKGVYLELEKLTIEEADKLGLKGFEYQAIIWESIRNDHEY